MAAAELTAVMLIRQQFPPGGGGLGGLRLYTARGKLHRDILYNCVANFKILYPVGTLPHAVMSEYVAVVVHVLPLSDF